MLVKKMLKKISNAEWAKIAAQAMRGKNVPLPEVCAGNWHLGKFPATLMGRIVEN